MALLLVAPKSREASCLVVMLPLDRFSTARLCFGGRCFTSAVEPDGKCWLSSSMST